MIDAGSQRAGRSGFHALWDQLNRFGNFLTRPHPSVEDAEQRLRARLLLAIIAGLSVFDFAYLAWVSSGSRYIGEFSFEQSPLVAAGGLVFLLVLYWLARTSYFTWAAALLVVGSAIVIYICVLLTSSSTLYIAWLLLGPLLGALFLSAWASGLLLLAVVVAVLALPWHGATAEASEVVHGEILLIALGAVLVAVAAVRQWDIARLKKQAAQLAENEARYQTLVELSPLAVVVNAGGRYAFANRAAAGLLGAASPEDVVGLDIAEHIHPDSTSMVAERVTKVLAGTVAQPGELTILRMDGAAVEVEATAARIDFNGEPACLVLYRDLTAQRRTEAELAFANSQLAQSQKMEAVGQLAGGIAHDFNNLLTAILGYSDLLLASNKIDTPEERMDIAEIRRAAERGSSLTRQILAFSRRQALAPKPTVINDIITGVAPLLRRTLGEHVDLEMSLDRDLGRCEIDVHQFEQVIVNLAVNARDAMPGGGRLVIETGGCDIDSVFCRTHPDANPGPHVVVSVTDTGIGMDEEVRTHVFEPFYTTKAPGEGTGLGLATVYGIVRQSGGSIHVDSSPGRGTTFKVYLPCLGRELEEPAPAPVEAPNLGGSETILLVEDEETLRTLISRMMRGLGYTVLAAGTAAEGLEMVEVGAAVPDVLVSDITLPGRLQGTDLAREIRVRHPSLPIVLMSGYAFRVGCDDDWMVEHRFLQKPFALDRLAATVREALDARQSCKAIAGEACYRSAASRG